MIFLKIYPHNSKYWFKNGEYHNNYGPAIKWDTGYTTWWANGKRHRTNGPAIEEIDGYECWWINGIEYNSYLEYLVAVEEYKQTC